MPENGELVLDGDGRWYYYLVDATTGDAGYYPQADVDAYVLEHADHFIAMMTGLIR